MDSPARPAPAPAALLYYVAFSQLLGLAVVAMTGTWLGVYTEEASPGRAPCSSTCILSAWS